MADALSIKVDLSDMDKLEGNLSQALQIDSMVNRMLSIIGLNVQADAVEMIQQGPGRSGVEYQRGGKSSTRSAEGEPAKTDTGNLASSVFFHLAGGDVAEVGYLDAIAPYGKYLEDENSLNRQVLNPSLAMNYRLIELQRDKLARDVLELITK